MTKICLEMTEAEARVLLGAATTERKKLRKFLDRRTGFGNPVNPEAVEDLAVLDRLVANLKGGLK